MTLPSSPPLSLSQIQGEFGGPGNLTAYYAGGGYVPSGTSGSFGPVPSSGSLDILVFCGTSNFLQQITVGVGSSGGGFPLYGYSSSNSFGSLSTSAFFAGGSITEFYYNSSDGSITLALDTGQPQSIFTTLNINGTGLSSGSASYGGSYWIWFGSGNPFGTSGSVLATFYP